MADQLPLAVARLVAVCPYVRAVHDLVTKQRIELAGDYVFDLYVNETLGKYTYALVQESRRLIGWDNALHHPGLDNFPHHFHREDGGVVSSPLIGVPERDIEYVAAELNEFLSQRDLNQ
jgi:hypothetical protein